MILLVGSQKGGCGKSTIAVNICAELARQGRDVVLVDADRQATATDWTTERAENDSLPTVHSLQKYDKIRSALQDLAKRYEVVVVDTAGRDSPELRYGSTVADILLVPFRPSQPDLNTLPRLQEIISDAKEFNPELTVHGLLTMAPTNHVINEASEAREVISDFADIKLLNTVVCDRKVYRDAMSDGRGVVEMNNDKAKAEIQALVSEVFQQ